MKTLRRSDKGAGKAPRRLAGVCFVLIALIAQIVVLAPSASAYPTSHVSLVGHGWGHGRGMSQYGSLGYALRGWDHNAILRHYYSNTTAGSVPNNPITVRIVSNDGSDLIFFSNTTYYVAGRAVAGGQASRIRRIGGNNFAVDRSGGCNGAGGWAQVFTTAGPVVADPSNSNPGTNLNHMLERCTAEGTRGYRGSLKAIDDNGTIRTINTLPVEDYLRGVVPRESPASWANLGGGVGINALRAQSVAARSYALAAQTYPYATTCDTTACQVYGGAFLNGVRIEDDRTDTAIAQTAGQVRLLNGAIARTEFSSSSGGYTAGGTFPAVADEGDSVSYNPNHTWTASVAVSAIEAKYPSIGSLVSVGINGRNGLGYLGGRVTSMTIAGNAGSVTISGAAFRSAMGLKSDWFQVTGVPSGGVNGYWQFAADGGVFSFGFAPFHGSAGAIRLAAPIVGMAGANNGGYWLVASDGGVFSYAGHAFFGSMGGRPLNRPIVGMAASPTKNGYWLVASDGGVFTFGDARFFGSTGNIRLNQPIVGMAPTPSGRGYWLVARDGGVFTFGDARYFGSLPGSRVATTATGIARTATGAGYMITSANGTVYPFGDAPQFGGVSTSVAGFRGHIAGLLPAY